jgi:hypothetical protein
MIAEAKQQYRGVLCRHCRQAIPLSPSAALKERGCEDPKISDLHEFALCSFTLRCRVCHGEGQYTVLDVIDCDGTPRIRSPQSRKGPLKVSKKLPVDLLNQAKVQSES